MTRLESLGEVISTDLLVIGAGIGGLTAAIRARELRVDVLVAEKATAGWSGKAPKGGGVLWVLTADDDLDRFVEYQVKNIGHYLNDQELLSAVAAQTLPAVERMEKWGVKIVRDAEGRLDTFKPFSHWSLAGVDLDMLKPLRKKARAAGAKLLNRVQLVELLKKGDRVTGAVGFNVVDGRFYTIKARATILANGSCNYMVMPMWSSGRGDGIAAAYRAGAEMRNAEFGNFYNVILKGNLSAIIGGQYALYNDLGENISSRYTAPSEADLDIGILLGMEKEVREGRGPVRFEPSEARTFHQFAEQFFVRWKRPKADEFWLRLVSKEQQYGSDHSPRPEAIPGFIGELSPIRVDHEMKTSLPGLWAIGDTSYGGSAWAGAVPAPPGRIRGSGLMNAFITAQWGGPAAARHASTSPPAEVDPAEVKRLKEEMFLPMNRQKGYRPADAIDEIQKLVSPVRFSVRKSRERLQEALSRVEAVLGRLPELGAKDYHGLARCNEARSITLCAEMYFRAALFRTESRGWHYREDHPRRDDENWLKWIIVKKDADKMMLHTERIPIERYPHRPQPEGA